MLTLKHKSNPASARLFRLTLLFALAVAVAAGPTAGTAMAEEPQAEPQPPQLVFEPDHHDFGLQPVNQSAAQTTFQLRNVGAEPARVDTLGISYPGSEVF